jgi:D-alanine-D-alanine ligase
LTQFERAAAVVHCSLLLHGFALVPLLGPRVDASKIDQKTASQGKTIVERDATLWRAGHYLRGLIPRGISHFGEPAQWNRPDVRRPQQAGSVVAFDLDPLPLRVALVTEGRSREDSLPSSESRDLDMTTPEQAERIRDLMNLAVDDVIVFSDLHDFIKQAPQLDDAVVWPHWNGSRNRNRTGYAAAICEIYGLRYVGPDPYARLIANDKSLSKIFLRRSGLNSPASVLIVTPAQAVLIETLRMPVIVKPNIEGSSIGIDQDSICTTTEETQDLALRKLRYFPEGIIVEEFVSGPEVFVSLAFDKHGSFRWGCSERVVRDELSFLASHVYDYSLKFSGERQVALRSIEFMSDELLSKIVQLTTDLKTIDLIRLDGRLRDGELLVIEITPDPLMTPHSEFLGTLALAGHEPAEVIRDIVERAAARSGTAFHM